MKISYKWLSQYIDIDLSPEELQNRMTFAGLEVEGVEKLDEDLNQYLVAEIIKCETHPDSDHLSNAQHVTLLFCQMANLIFVSIDIFFLIQHV